MVQFYFWCCFLSACFVSSVFSIKCYQCYMAEHPYFIAENAAVKTCHNIDYSEDFIKDCPESTFCFKKTAEDFYYKEKFTRVERGCAKQLYRGQKFDFYTGWSELNYIVGDAYKNGCKKTDSFGLRSTKMEECYCDRDLCNSSQRSFSCSGKRLGLVFIVAFICLMII